MWVAECSYFFRLSKYKQQLLDLLEAQPDFIAPEDRRKEIISMLTDQEMRGSRRAAGTRGCPCRRC